MIQEAFWINSQTTPHIRIIHLIPGRLETACLFFLRPPKPLTAETSVKAVSEGGLLSFQSLMFEVSATDLCLIRKIKPSNEIIWTW